jgi:hypothetical protein
MRGQSYLAMIGLGWTGGITLLAILSEGQPSSDNRKYFSVFAQLSTRVWTYKLSMQISCGVIQAL